MENSAPQYLHKVKSDEWLNTFLGRISSSDTFNSLLAQTRVREPALTPEQAAALNRWADDVIRHYDRRELITARHYYNTEHLILFWRYLIGEIEKLGNEQVIDSEFPVFSIVCDMEHLTYRATSVPLDTFAGDSRPALHDEGNGTERLVALFNKLDALIRTNVASIKKLYDLFICTSRRSDTPVWAYYRIHYFLDHHLYTNGQGRCYRAHFDNVFFNNNTLELKIFLQYHYSHGLPVPLSEVVDFLARQREDHLRRALIIDMEENEIQNRRKDLLRYDPQTRLVSLAGITQQLKDHFRTTILEPYGVQKQNGCPFARSKGIQRNAVLEVFEHHDRLILRLLARADEFQRLFAPSALD